MKQSLKNFKSYWESDASFISLLVMLVFTVFVLPVIIDVQSRDSTILFNLLLISLFVVGLFSAREKAFIIISIVFVSLHLLLRVIRFSDTSYEFYFIERVVIVLNLVLFAVINIRLLFRDNEVNTYRIIGAVNVYLSVALAGAFGFELIHLLTGKSLSGEVDLVGGDKDFITYTYFGLSSLTTVGFGDIYPASASARMLSVFLSAIGILYPAVVIARLVSTGHGVGPKH
jgi:hypothetical protein